MRLNEFLVRMEEQLKHPLPGAAAHEPLRATPAGPIKPKFEHLTPPKPGSVLILIYEDYDSLWFPLTKRPDYPGTHGGQISLPGGKSEAGEGSVVTAIREGHEEVGIDPATIQIIGKLSEFFVIPSNYMVTPVVAYTLQKPLFVPQISEVERIVIGNLDEILKDDAIHTKEILAARKYPMIAPHFQIDSEIVWGATAMILNELRMILRSSHQ